MKKTAAIIIMVLLLVNIFIYTNIFAEGKTVSLIITTNADFDADLFCKKFDAVIEYRYEHALNGVCASVGEDSIEAIKAFKGVEGVFAETYYTLPDPVEDPAPEELFAPASGFRLMSGDGPGFDGEGVAVAVIDSGCNINNTVFPEPSNTSAVKYSKSDVADILSSKNLNAEVSVPSLTANDVYKNAKFPFVFDYDSKDFDVYNSAVVHGHSVAGVIGGCGTGVNGGSDYYGGLPQCQLLIFKVVSATGSIREGDFLAALEDAIALGVDGINASIGSVAGFSTSQTTRYDFSSAITSARQAGIFVAMAAGNDGFLGRNGLASGATANSPSVLTPDYGLICYPSVCDDAMSVASATSIGSSLSANSAWGPAPNLKLKPDIAAHGVSVTVSLNANGSFVSGRNGTSYASPDLCAKGVAVAHHLRSSGNYSGLALSRMTDNILMSSADIVTAASLPISPRKQGSGFADTSRALSINSVMYGADGKTKLSHGDFSGNAFTMNFFVRNISDSAVSYSPSASVITDKASGQYLTLTPELVQTTSVTFSPSQISLAPGEEKAVSLQIVLNSAYVTSKSSVFRNGFYVEGFIVLTGNGTNGDVINMPYSAFRGNWLDVPVFIPSDTQYTTGFATFFSGSSPSDMFYYGNNLFTVGYKAPTAAPLERVSFSPNEDGLLDTARLYLGTYRNIRTCRVTITDGGNNTVKTLSLTDLPKNSGINLLTNNSLTWNGKNSLGNLCPDGRYYYTITADLDYPGGQNAASLTLPIFLDTAVPEIQSVALSIENGRKYLDISARDNHLIAAIMLSDGVTKASLDVLEPASASGSFRFDITDHNCESFLLEAGDFALNYSGVTITPGKDYVAYYNAAGALTRAEVYDIADIYAPPERSFSLLTGEVTAKRFIWTYNMMPAGSN